MPPRPSAFACACAYTCDGKWPHARKPEPEQSDRKLTNFRYGRLVQQTSRLQVPPRGFILPPDVSFGSELSNSTSRTFTCVDYVFAGARSGCAFICLSIRNPREWRRFPVGRTSGPCIVSRGQSMQAGTCAHCRIDISKSPLHEQRKCNFQGPDRVQK